MTKSEFFRCLLTQLSFLDSDEQQKITAFYQLKLSDANTLDEEAEIIESFGSPEKIAESIRAFSTTRGSDEAKFNLDLISFFDHPTPPSEPPMKIKAENAASDEDDLIFSRPLAVEKAPELIHSLENREVKTLYGEKVIIENKSEPIEEFALEPMDEENGMTPEEIEMAKAETLEKTEMFSAASFGISDENECSDFLHTENADAAKKKILIEEEEELVAADCAPLSTADTKEYQGVFSRAFSAVHLPAKSHLVLTILCSVILSPVLFAVFGAGIVGYALITAIILLSALVLFALMVVFVIVGVLELVYGFLILFDSIAVALIELGLGTILFALVTAVAALIYEFIFAIVPKVLRKVTVVFSRSFKKFHCYLYGGKA